FCGMKGIKREFSVTRTAQQNGVTEERIRPSLRVLVTKPHNKTPYELLLGGTPSIGFMRPFGCPITILNTLDSLRKFDGKANEGFLVRYSVNSKAFRVFNSRTRIVQETLHIIFFENQPNVARSGPKLLFDIDTLTQSMNFQPVVAGNQLNHSAGIKENLNVCKVRKATQSAQQYVLLLLWSTGSQDPHNTNAVDDADGVECLPNEEIFAELARIQGNFDVDKVVKEAESAQQYVLLPLWSTGSKDPQNTNVDAAFDDKENESEVHVSPSSSNKPKKHDKKAKREAKGKSPIDLRMHLNRGKIAELDADENVTLVDVDIAVEMDVDIQGKVEEDVTAIMEINAAEPESTVFNDEEVTMTYDQKQENIDWNGVAEKMQEKHLDNIKKYQSLKRKPISIAQSRKNIIVYLKNMAGYKIQHFKGMTYDQESFKKLRAEVEVLGFDSTQEETPIVNPQEMSKEDVKNMLQIIPVAEFKVEALQVKYPLIDWEIYFEGSRNYWRIIRVGGIIQVYKSFEDMKLYTNCEVHQVSSTNRYDIFMFLEKEYPLTNVVLLLMLSAKLQFDEDCEMVRDLAMKIFMEANKPKSERSLDTSSN
nr:retrovirus-related Pol polyprotein from transposon TNT 1-94 [Tanacetum cinerariifolium]